MTIPEYIRKVPRPVNTVVGAGEAEQQWDIHMQYRVVAGKPE